METVIFQFDRERDLFNIWKACNSDTSYGYDFKRSIPTKIKELCFGRDYKDIKKELGKILEKIHKSTLVKDFIKFANSSWRRIEKEYFKRMNKIMKNKFPKVKVKAYLTTISKCSYNHNKKSPYFMFNFFSSIPYTLQTSGHEIMHLYFHYFYWEKTEEKIGYEKTKDLKEALTILLNIEFRDLWIAKDEGYPNHKKLREFITKEWEKKKDMDILLDKCIDYLQK